LKFILIGKGFIPCLPYYHVHTFKIGRTLDNSSFFNLALALNCLPNVSFVNTYRLTKKSD